MELKEIASVSGKPGLWTVLKPTRNGVILESLDEKKFKLVVTSNFKVSILSDISIYTTTREGSVPLQEVLTKIYTKSGDALEIESGASDANLYNFIEGILPEVDRDRVYPSDLKKLFAWYKILVKEAPSIVKGEEKKEAKDEKKAVLIEEKAEKPKAVKKEKKPKTE